MADTVVIALFRHGLTEENKRKAYLGWNDSPLCVEKKPIDRNYESFFSSDLQRCRMTAKQLFPNRECILLENLREMNFGIWEGKTYDDLKDDLFYQRWLSNPFDNSPTGGESFQKFSMRVRAGWKEIVQEIFAGKLKRCAVITHGGVIRYLLTEFAPEKKDFWNWHVSHDLGFEMIFEKDALWGGDRCTLLQEVPLTANELG